MIGRDATEISSERVSTDAEKPAGPPFIQADLLGRRNAIENLNLQISPGEALGLAGLLGSGRTESARLLFGVDRPTTGSLRIDGQIRSHLTPKGAVGLGFGYCSEDRKTEGIIPNLSIRENIILALEARRGPLRPISFPEQNRLAQEYISGLKVATTDSEKPIKFLSGGNQQKVLLGRWLASAPRFLILDEPTRGIDVGAKFEILKLVKDLLKRGMAILFISSELEEVVRTCTRVVVLRDRKQVRELEENQISEEAIMSTIAENGESS
jgi:monosaccharide-transporting ATPase